LMTNFFSLFFFIVVLILMMFFSSNNDTDTDNLRVTVAMLQYNPQQHLQVLLQMPVLQVIYQKQGKQKNDYQPTNDAVLSIMPFLEIVINC
jgi:hypothetical protein